MPQLTGVHRPPSLERRKGGMGLATALRSPKWGWGSPWRLGLQNGDGARHGALGLQNGMGLARAL